MMLSHLPWEQALGLDGIDPLSSPAVKDRWLALTLALALTLTLALALALTLTLTRTLTLTLTLSLISP